MTTGHGGWPMNVFITPEKVPFYGGTYFPPTPRYGMPACKQILLSMAEAYRDRRDEVSRTANEILGELETSLDRRDIAEWRIERRNSGHRI